MISVFSALEIFYYFQNVMLFSEKCADPDEKSYYACGNSSRSSLFAKLPLLGESTKGKQNYFSLLLTAKVVVSYVICPTRIIVFQKYSNVFVFTHCMLSNFFCPEHFLNLTDLSPSSPARRFAEPGLGQICLYDQSQTFSF